MEIYASENLLENFDSKLDEFIKIKKPLLESKKSEMLDFIYNLTDTSKQILCKETNKVIAGFKTLQERKLINNELLNNLSFCDEFYEMSKYFNSKFFNKVIEDKQKHIDKDLENKTEKELLIMIIKMLNKILK